MAVSKKQKIDVGALLKQAVALHNDHKLDGAIERYQKILKADPNHPDGLNLLGLARYQQGRMAEAEELLSRAVRARPNFRQAWLHYGNLRQQMRDFDGAIAAFEEVLRIAPDFAPAHLNIGNCLRILGRKEEAMAAFERAIAIKPDYSLAWANLGKMARELGNWPRAVEAAEAAVACDDPSPLAYNIWIDVQSLAKPSAELAARVTQMLDHPGSTGDLLADGQFLAHHIHGLDPQVLLRTRDRVERQIEAVVDPSVRAACPKPRSQPLTLGFLSGAFRRHPVSFMALGAVEQLRAQDFRLCFYSGVTKPDDHTERFQACADRWVDIRAMSDEDVVATIRADEVDVLFDMSGITNNGRPRIPAMRAAPLQIKWVGGQCGPSGIPEMDAFLTDWVESPPGAEADHHEKLLRMPNGYVTFVPSEFAPEPLPVPPAQLVGHITFGSLNKINKLSAELLRTWARILEQVPASRLLIRASGADQPAVMERVRAVLAECGIGSERVSFEGSALHREFLQTYNRIDVALDSFPYTGGLTTCEALWMGVPAVALAGRFFSERHAATHLHNVGLGELVAQSEDEYVAIAVGLARDVPRLARFRRELRDRVARSPLCDHALFAADLAHLLRSEWARRFGGAVAPSLAGARARLAAGDAAGTIEECRRLMESGEVSAAVLELSGIAAHAAGQVADAVDLLQTALAVEPERRTTLKALLEIVEPLGEVEIAEQLRRELARLGA